MRRLTLAAALAGLADTASFAVTRRQVLASKPERAAGTGLSIVLWAVVAQGAASGAAARTRAAAAANLALNGAMLGIHLGRRIPNPRIYTGTALAAAAFAGTLAG